MPDYVPRLREALAFQQNGQLAVALDIYYELLGAYPDTPEILRQAGFAKSLNGEEQAALADAQRAAILEPGHYLNELTLGMIQANAWQLDAAIASYRRAWALHQQEALVPGKLATALVYAGQLQEAEKICRQAFRLNPWQTEAHLALMTVFNHRHQFAACLAHGKRIRAYYAARPSAHSENTAQDADFLEKIQEHFSHAKRGLAIQQQIPPAFRAGQGPLFILSPVMRSGSTLIQRLFNSTRQTLVYGENWHMINNLPESIWFAAGEQALYGSTHQRNRQRLLEGGEDFFTYNLFPDTGEYLSLVMQNFYRVIAFYHRSAQKAGFTHWGLKDPRGTEWLKVLRLLLPQARFILLYRNLLDVARSFKARGHYRTPAELSNVAAKWRDSVIAGLQLDAPNVLILKYENLVASPEAEIRRLEDFAGISGIERAVMARKINIHDQVDSAGYQPPAELSEDEQRIIMDTAGPLLRRLGYV